MADSGDCPGTFRIRKFPTGFSTNWNINLTGQSFSVKISKWVIWVFFFPLVLWGIIIWNFQNTVFNYFKIWAKFSALNDLFLPIFILINGVVAEIQSRKLQLNTAFNLRKLRKFFLTHFHKTILYFTYVPKCTFFNGYLTVFFFFSIMRDPKDGLQLIKFTSRENNKNTEWKNFSTGSRGRRADFHCRYLSFVLDHLPVKLQVSCIKTTAFIVPV